MERPGSRVRPLSRVLSALALAAAIVAAVGCDAEVGPGRRSQLAPVASHRRPAAGTVRSSAPSASSAAAAAWSECTTADLSVTFINDQDAAGTAYDDLDFTNRTDRTCLVAGWPTVAYVTSKGGNQVGALAIRASGLLRTIALAPGVTAQAPLTFGDSASDTPTYCGASVPAEWIRIYPPRHDHAVFLALGFSIPACSHAQFRIGSLRAKPSGG